MPVAVHQPQRKDDALDSLAKGLGIASAIYGIKTNMAQLDEYADKKKMRDAELDRMKRNVISGAEEAKYKSDGYAEVPQGTANAVAFQREDGSPLYMAIQPKSPLADSLARERLDFEKQKHADALALENKKLKPTTVPDGIAPPPNYKDKVKGLNASDKARLDNVLMASKAIDDMGAALGKGDSTWKVLGDNDFTIAEREFTEALGRMQSGGAIGKDEEKRFQAMAPRAWDSDEIRATKLRKMKNEMESRLTTLGFNRDEVPSLANRSPSTTKEKQSGAIAGPGALPNTVIQNGHTYTLNPKTGQYE